jgi:DNA replication protein
MKRFGGFPSNIQFTAIPDMFFSHLMPEISDMAELKTTLVVLYLLYKKRGYPRFTTLSELAGQTGLMKSFTEENKKPEDTLKTALQLAVSRGTILHLSASGETGSDAGEVDVFYLNTDADIKAMAKFASGEMLLPGIGKLSPKLETITQAMPDIFSLYEENIGILTPMIVEEIREAQKTYSDILLRDAIKEAAKQNKRKWSYISAILERWAAEGRSDGTYRRDTKKTDPDKYIKGKYGHMVQR